MRSNDLRFYGGTAEATAPLEESMPAVAEAVGPGRSKRRLGSGHEDLSATAKASTIAPTTAMAPHALRFLASIC